MKLKNILLGLAPCLLVAAPIATITSCNVQDKTITAIEVTSDKDDVSIRQSLQMGIRITPSSVTSAEVEWSIDNEQRGSIDPNGLFHAASYIENKGDVVVTATLKDHPEIHASKTIKVVDYQITPNFVCSGGISGNADPFNLGEALTVKYTLPQAGIDLDINNIKVNDKVLTIYDFTQDEDYQTIKINRGVFESIAELASTVTIDLTTTQSSKIIPTIQPATGLKASECKVNSVEGGKTLLLNYETEQDYGIATKDDITATITYSDGSSVTKNAESIDKKNKEIRIVIPAANDEEKTVASVSVAITTCELWDKTDGIDYIYNRTFSIKAGSGYGTMWIINPYDDTHLSDYTYYIATNWHVKYQIMSAAADYYIGNGKTGNVTNYQKIYVMDWYDDVNFTFDGSIDNAVDLAVATVNLQAAAAADVNIKNQLDALNTYYEQHGYITQLADATSESVHYENKILYTAGFPQQSLGGPAWEEHTLQANSLTYANWETEHANHSFQISQTGKQATDICPGYYITEAQQEPIMAPGSSGSMMVGNFGTDEHPYFKVVAIYYGGFSSQEEAEQYKIHPCFTIFNNDRKNFLKDFI